MPNNAIALLRGKVAELEAEIEREFEQHRARFHYTIEKKRIEFESTVLVHHKALRTSALRFLRESKIHAVIASPIIYAQIIPLLLLDLAVTLFQAICFPIYGIAKVPRDDFIVIDRHHLAYLNPIEKLNCAFCGYANGLLAYAREIAGRTESHWCPIKHARRVRGAHRGYFEFSEYGDADQYRGKTTPDKE